MSTPVERITSALEAHGMKGKGTSWQCPAHEDKRASLSVSLGDGNCVLIFCHAGCPPGAIVKALGLEMRDLFELEPEEGRTDRERSKPWDRPVKEIYPYRDEAGNLLYQVVRFADRKDFAQRRPDPTSSSRWRWSLGETRRVLFRLPETIRTAKDDRLVFIVEGEKDVLSLVELGLDATCNPGGAGKWSDSFADSLLGARVVILPDNDEPGRRHAKIVARSLARKAASVRVLSLAGLPTKGDVSDWITAGHTRDELLALAEAAPSWTELAGEEPERKRDTAPAPSVTVRLADVRAERVTWLWDARIPFGKVTLFDGDPGLGKSTLALEVAARLTTGRALPEGEAVGPANVVILTAEDGLADTIRPRLDAAGADVNCVFALTAARSEDGEETFPTLDGNLPALADAVRRHEARLVIIDPLMAFLGGNVNSWRDQDVRRVLAPLAKLAEQTDTAVVVIRHLTKSGGSNAVYRGGGSIGIAGAARSILLVAKDPGDEGRRIVASSKSNLGAPPASLAYRLGAAGLACRIVFDGTSTLTAQGLLEAAAADAEPAGRGAREEAGAFLSDLLRNGPVSTPDVQTAARKAGHAWQTVRRAKDALGVVVEKLGFTGGWIWRLPVEGVQEKAKASTPGVWTSSGEVGHLREGAPRTAEPGGVHPHLRFDL